MNASIKNKQSEPAIVYVGYVLLFISCLVSARYAYLSHAENQFMGILWGAGMAGINMAVAYLIRWAVVSKREKRILPLLVACIGIFFITNYSLTASSTLFGSSIERNKQLALADKLDIEAENDIIKMTSAEYSAMVAKGGFSKEDFAQQEARMAGASANAKRNQSSIIRNGVTELKSLWLLIPISSQMVASIISLALEFAIIGIIAFRESVLTPTPLGGVLRYIDQWLAPDVRVEDTVLQNPWGGGTADKVGETKENLQHRELEMQKETNKVLTEHPAPSQTENKLYSPNTKAVHSFGFIDTNTRPTSPKIEAQKNIETSYKTPQNQTAPSLTNKDIETSYKTPQETKEEGGERPEGEGKYNLLKARLAVAETGDVGAMIECVNCGKKIKKMTYTHKFCSHSRKARNDGGNCNNDYHDFLKSRTTG